MSTTIDRWERAEEFEHKCFDEKKTQSEMILEYLQKYGEITPLEALSAIGCFQLAARIADLRADGHKITTEMSQNGKKSHAVYRLEVNDGEI